MVQDANDRYQAMLASMRDSRDSSVLKDYTVDSANTEEDKNYPQENSSLDNAFIPDDENFTTGSTVLDAGYNTAKMISEYAMETLPLAERLLGFNAYGDEGSKHSGYIDSLYGLDPPRS